MNKFSSTFLVLIVVIVLSFTNFSFINNNVANIIINFFIIFVGSATISKFINKNYIKKKMLLFQKHQIKILNKNITFISEIFGKDTNHGIFF